MHEHLVAVITMPFSFAASTGCTVILNLYKWWRKLWDLERQRQPMRCAPTCLIDSAARIGKATVYTSSLHSIVLCSSIAHSDRVTGISVN